jgi:uncharacterized protein (TIGR03067 family)
MSQRIFAITLLTVGVVAADPVPAQQGEVPSGTWAVVSSEEDGKPSKFPVKGTLFTFTDGKVTIGPKKAEGKVLYAFKANPKRSPKEIDLVLEDDKKKVVLRGIYQVEKGRLVISIGIASGGGEDKVVEGKRPTEFKSGPKVQLLTLEPGGQ